MGALEKFFDSVATIIFVGFLSYFVPDASAHTAAIKPAPVVQATRGLLFEIKSQKNTAYLFGSIHMAKKDFYPMSPKVESAYTLANTVAIEADVSDQNAVMAIMPKLSYVNPDKLENHLSAKTWGEVKAMLGSSAEQLQSVKPAVLTSAVVAQMAMQMGFDPAQGIDLHYIQRAKADKKKLVELESLDFQANILGGLSDSEGESLIVSMLDSMKKGEFVGEFNRMVDAWKNADAASIAKLFTEAGSKDEGSKKMSKLLLDDRNEGMVAKINQLMSSGEKLFVVVGAGHLAGEKSIIDLLKKQGLSVKQIE